MMGNVSRETYDRLDAYENLLMQWNPKINLIAPSTIPNIRQRHIDDSLQITKHACPERGSWVDLGSGGGLPGIVLAIAFADRPISFTLIESDKRKSAFLRNAIRLLSLENAKVINERIEKAVPQNADFISARALAPLPRLMPYVTRHMADTGQAWLLKGARWKGEIIDTKRIWAFNCRAIRSTSETEAAILQIDGICHV